MTDNVIPRPRPRIGVIRVRDQIRLATPTQGVIVPVAEFPQFIDLTRAIASRHQRAAQRVQPAAA
jgi:hypothetical protein